MFSLELLLDRHSDDETSPYILILTARCKNAEKRLFI